MVVEYGNTKECIALLMVRYNTDLLNFFVQICRFLDMFSNLVIINTTGSKPVAALKWTLIAS